MHDATSIRSALDAAFERFLVGWAAFDGHRYSGRPSSADRRSFCGPLIWSEQDCVYRLALQLEHDYPGQVHMEFKMSASSVYGFDPAAGDRRQAVDLVVSDLSNFVEGPDSHRDFGTKTHELFVEAKWFQKGFWGNSIKNALEGVERDAAHQARRLAKRQCHVAVIFIVDDDSTFESRRSELSLPPEVDLLVASPLALESRPGIGRG